MKLSTRTITILKNFSQINQSISVQPGNILRTISDGRTLLGKAIIEETFVNPFAIYNLSRFLGILELFTEPEIEFGDKSLSIMGKENSLTYNYAADETLVLPPKKDIVLPNVDVKFVLKQSQFDEVSRARSVLGHPRLAVVGDGSKVYIRALNIETPNHDVYSVEIGDTEQTFMVVYRPENLKIMEGDYVGEISKKGISRFVGKQLEYWVAIESTSKFE